MRLLDSVLGDFRTRTVLLCASVGNTCKTSRSSNINIASLLTRHNVLLICNEFCSQLISSHVNANNSPLRSVQPAGWDACEEKPASFLQFHARFYVRIPEADRAALEQQLGKISWLPARAGFIAGITAPIEAGKVLSGGIQPASAWPIFE